MRRSPGEIGPEARRGQTTLPRVLPAGRSRSGCTSGRLGCRRRANPSHPSRVGFEPTRTPNQILQIWRLPLHPLVPGENLRTEREAPAPPPLAFPCNILSHICRAEPVPPARTQRLAARVRFSFPAPLPCSFPVVPRIRGPSAFCLAPFPLSFLSPYPYPPPLV